MPENPLSKLVTPRYPTAAVGLESSNATVIMLERRRRENFTLRRAAAVALPESLVRPGFEEQNVADISELADALAQLAQGAGLARQRKWSVALPEASTRTTILTLESAPASRVELEEVLRWKTERGFGVPLDELRVSRERLAPDAQGRARYLATAMRATVLDEYESVFAQLGWRAGMMLPRHIGEAQWLHRSEPRGGHGGDALLISSHSEGFTAVLLHNAQPLVARSVICEAGDCDDELYRLLLFYRDRIAPAGNGTQIQTIERLLVMGDGFGAGRVGEIVNETLGVNLRELEAEDVGLTLPVSDFGFDQIAAPAGLATLAWQ